MTPTIRSALRLCLVLACGASGAAACRRSGRSEAPAGILLISVDTLRADHCSSYGYVRPTTPHLDQLGRDGVRFEVAYASMATTGPSHTTMLTGLPPRAHGVFKNGQTLGPAPPTLAEILQAHGYRTAAFVSAQPLDRASGLARGFLTYDDAFPSASAPGRPPVATGPAAPRRRGDATRAAAVAWLRRNGYLQAGAADRQPPFFLWVHLYDPHSPYEPPAEERALFAVPDGTELDRQVAGYDGGVHFADEQTGALLDALARAGRLEQTLVIVTGDHGEGLLEHGIMGHGLSLYEETVRVPLIFRWTARLRGGRTVTAPVELTDLLPTVLELAGIPPPGGAGQGRSLGPVLTSSTPGDPRREIFLQRRQYSAPQENGVPVKGDKYAVRVGRWKYIAAPEEGTYELYDLEADPHERRNLHSERPREAAALAATLRRWQQSVAPARGTEVPEERARALRALGYVR
ncbi:MAG: hypothetical protein DMF80_01220 [Acidobacteria bacterium]|nr:MAG: hypothetical protein DMF80_01220 [Acidobacteriota bacterium]